LEDHFTLSLKCAVEEQSKSTEETSFLQRNQTLQTCSSSLIKRQELLRAGNTRTDQLIFNPQVDQPISKSGPQTPTGGKSSRLKERTS
jgi:hypothetical protein